MYVRVERSFPSQEETVSLVARKRTNELFVSQ